MLFVEAGEATLPVLPVPDDPTEKPVGLTWTKEDADERPEGGNEEDRTMIPHSQFLTYHTRTITEEL